MHTLPPRPSIKPGPSHRAPVSRARSGRATLLGSKTFGKAVIQTVEELDDGSAVVVTIAQYQTPKKTNINQRGIEVDGKRDCPSGAAAVACIADDLKSALAAAQ